MNYENNLLLVLNAAFMALNIYLWLIWGFWWSIFAAGFSAATVFFLISVRRRETAITERER